ncbi:unnamed protein product, partial [Gongylonema pulchrum]
MDRLTDFPFSVKQDTGHILLNTPLNYGKAREYRFLVCLHSENHMTAKAVSVVTVRIIDVNDNRPEIENSQERVRIPEDSPVGSSVAVFSISDPDFSGSNPKIHYFLKEGNDNATFKLNEETGWLTLAKELDRELIGEYKLVVNARDEGRRAVQKTITVVVKDVNDSPPQFRQKNYFAQYNLDELKSGQKILRLDVR